jgi:HD domain-containing protein
MESLVRVPSPGDGAKAMVHRPTSQLPTSASLSRRDFGQKITAAAIAACAGSLPLSSEAREAAPVAPARLVVAGVRIVDSSIARQATELSRDASPPYLFNHALRTFIFGSLIGKAMSMKFDQELLYLACILHDLGLTERFAGDQPFEIAGAQAAGKFLRDHHYSEERVNIVWDGIAMHPLAIGQFKRAEILLVGAGAGADVLGPPQDHVSESVKNEVIDSVPRMGFKEAFVQTCAEVVRRHPGSSGRTFMRDIAERNVSGFKPPNICDLIAKAPFKE